MLLSAISKRFDTIVFTTEYWNARELSEVLQYKKWKNFSKVKDRAKLACKNSGRNIEDDFLEVSKIVEAGATQKKV